MMHINYNKKKNDSIVTAAATFLTLATILVVSSVSIPLVAAPLASLQSADATSVTTGGEPSSFTSSDNNLARPKAPSVISGENVYIAWWTNNTTENGNEEVMFRASTDGGATFSNSTNLSNTTDANSWRVEIAGEGDNVIVSWWETNQTSDIPVARVSNDAGETFGPLLILGANGTLGSAEETEEVALVEDEE